MVWRWILMLEKDDLMKKFIDMFLQFDKQVLNKPENLYDDAQYWEKSGNFEKAWKIYNKAAEAGSADAQCVVGNIYLAGNEDYKIEKNHSQALTWLLKASDSGHKRAQYLYGSMHYNGFGTSVNYEKAFEHFNKSANQGQNEALVLLYVMYREGYGVEKNDNKAIEFLKRAADQDFVYAQELLGKHYIRTGRIPEAIYYLNLAEKEGSKVAYNLLRYLEKMNN